MSTHDDLKHDIRARALSPKRDRQAREKYWNYRVINPTHQRTVDHFDTQPTTYHSRYVSTYYSPLPPFRPECRVVTPTKRQLFDEAQQWPRPQRRHAAAKYVRHEERRKCQADKAGMGMAKDWSPAGNTSTHANRKVGRSGIKRTRCVVPSGLVHEAFDTNDHLEQRAEVVTGFTDPAHVCSAELLSNIAVEEDELVWQQLAHAEARLEREEKHADALIAALDEQASKVAAIREYKMIKQMAAQGWDLMDYESDFELV